uniref:Uncharacterized protein n=1 Tax=Haptolina ericina TaxID=156174 RepID=A0A6T8ZGJ8_9EUKA|mmetsp:Transcript_10357/g.23700  ORF Transcript_10357/g.23700 Transcript_10357/m.23700 type:complete len:106 (+) Transcript_10357:94-411(+)
MAEFKDLPPLSPERLAELVSMSPNYDDYDVAFARHWCTGKYEDPTLEATYRIFHLRLWGPRARFLLGPGAILGNLLTLVSDWNEVVPSLNQLSVLNVTHIRSHDL